MMIRLLIALATAAALAAAGTVYAATYETPLGIGDAAIATCGSAIEVTLFGPGDALVSCVKGGLASGADGAADLYGGLVYVVDLSTGDDLAVTCPGALALEWGANDVALLCEW